MPSNRQHSCRDRLTSAVTDAKTTLPRVEILLVTQPQRTGGSSGAKPGTKPPWHPAAASLVFDITWWARDTEKTLHMVLGHAVRSRGMSDANTVIALDNIIVLGEAAGDERGFAAASWLERWHGRAARTLGDASEVRRLPKQPGESERVCPFCHCLTLRYLPLHGLVKCINPGCRDQEGRRPSAKLEYSAFTAQVELVWCDGVVGLPPFSEENAA